MASSVVSISATDGAAGEEIAPLVANRLGYRLVDEQIVSRAAEEAGVDPSVVADVEQRKSLVARILESMPRSGMGAATLMGPMPVLEESSPAGDELRGLIRSTIEEIAAQGEAVIVAHAASYALSDRPEVLRVLVTASPQKRAARTAETRGCDAKEAEKLVSRGDANRADYLKRFYKVDGEGPADYDLVFNTDRIAPEQAAEVIVQVAQS